MGHYQQNRLINKYNDAQRDKEFHQTQAKYSKFGTLFAGASTGMSAIAAIIAATENKTDGALYLAFLALMSGFICCHAHYTHQNSIKLANKCHKQMRNAQRAYKKDHQKTR